ncbi:ATP-dependent DNA helicase Q-like 4A [Platanthera guangdongensis]|uniref:ATP-dependent DNA helicase Q-like 4A n=1 Tax=Platanthera guangdongensis TaxID=2320717 RepID=A0ABR2N1T8_9ASPA
MKEGTDSPSSSYYHMITCNAIKLSHDNMHAAASGVEQWSEPIEYGTAMLSNLSYTGINKPDVRFVIHHSLPMSIEGVWACWHRWSALILGLDYNYSDYVEDAGIILDKETEEASFIFIQGDGPFSTSFFNGSKPQDGLMASIFACYQAEDEAAEVAGSSQWREDQSTVSASYTFSFDDGSPHSEFTDSESSDGSGSDSEGYSPDVNIVGSSSPDATTVAKKAQEFGEMDVFCFIL